MRTVAFTLRLLSRSDVAVLHIDEATSVVVWLRTEAVLPYHHSTDIRLGGVPAAADASQRPMTPRRFP
jgi:hypothetical protein